MFSEGSRLQHASSEDSAVRTYPPGLETLAHFSALLTRTGNQSSQIEATKRLLAL